MIQVHLNHVGGPDPDPFYFGPGRVYLGSGPVYFRPGHVYFCPGPVYFGPDPVDFGPRPVYFHPSLAPCGSLFPPEANMIQVHLNHVGGPDPGPFYFGPGPVHLGSGPDHYDLKKIKKWKPLHISEKMHKTERLDSACRLYSARAHEGQKPIYFMHLL